MLTSNAIFSMQTLEAIDIFSMVPRPGQTILQMTKAVFRCLTDNVLKENSLLFAYAAQGTITSRMKFATSPKPSVSLFVSAESSCSTSLFLARRTLQGNSWVVMNGCCSKWSILSASTVVVLISVKSCRCCYAE